MPPTTMAVENADSMQKHSHALHVDVQCDVKRANVPTTIAAWINRTAAAAGLDTTAEVSVRIVDAAEMRALNRKFRNRDTSTNVLAFPCADLAGMPTDALRVLGDIVVCMDVVCAEAAARDVPLADHWAHMFVHGMLHLLGYDHEHPEEAAKMERLEAEILASGGIANPYCVC